MGKQAKIKGGTCHPLSDIQKLLRVKRLYLLFQLRLPYP
jgi:hypothetical protein